ncbi:hypothetical protein [Cerasicoccus arenae]|uniref:Uncharacterized protein n=1 Tax=Cerasicoccus arenae TaxID=424488 RepID=A0A8J3GEE8_9BACT|nr:hypothetical protein [Cerasicoccus arenae]MBK1860045.1 hypothetical protein [Cerasicoccus arenae]GHC13975.1 hypothetical protein GCM10007047_34040 [Cerasicoccus arenae]
MAEVLKGGVTSIVLLVVQGANFIPKALEKKLRKYTTESDFSGIEAACRSNKSVLAKLGGYISTHTHIPFEILFFGVTDMIGRAVSRQHLRGRPKSRGPQKMQYIDLQV